MPLPLLRTRGGISFPARGPCVYGYSSPHTRRYFLGTMENNGDALLFSAHAEVFPKSGYQNRLIPALLRTRGGISKAGSIRSAVVPSSPHTRRYFPDRRAPLVASPLFSAHAEVFPPRDYRTQGWNPLLRTRGGISYSTGYKDWTTVSSPHTRRYFPGRPRRSLHVLLFSAHAEVFPCQASAGQAYATLLRTRGGISPPGECGYTKRRSSPHTRRHFHRG